VSSIKDAENEPRSTITGEWRRVIRLLGVRQRAQFGLLTGARIAVGFFDLALAAAMYLLFLLLESRTPAHNFWWTPKTALEAALLAASLVLFRALVDILSSRAVLHEIQCLYKDFLLRLTRGYGEMQWRQFVKLNRSELSNHTIHTAREAADFYHRSIEMAAGLVTIAVMTVAFVYESPVAACVFAGAVAAFYCGHKLFIRARVRRAASNREISMGKLQRKLADMFLSGKEIRAYGNQAFFHDRVDREAERFAVASRQALLLPHVGRIIADQGTVLLFLGLIIVVQLRQGDSQNLLALLAFYFVLSRRMLPLVSQMSLIAGQMDSSYENVKIVDTELKDCRRYRTLPLPVELPAPGLVLELEQVTFSFGEGVKSGVAAPILRNINLRLHLGEIVVLHGASGIGKSSLLNLIAGVSQPVSGVVRADRSSIAYVPQEIALLDESIRNNLLFGLPEKSDEDLMSALAVACLDDFVAAQPLGLETSAGDNGVLISGGERQRLGLARAILRGSRLLLLDEATSALDEETERRVLENLSRAGTAVFLATHRLLAHRFADRVYELQDGCLIDASHRQFAIGPLASRTDFSVAKPCRQLRPGSKFPSSTRRA
jgi:ABC-type multidrug transport system fused ATPase/permease subunit